MALELADPYWGRVELAERVGWPRDPAEQARILLSIRPWEWGTIPGSNLDLLATESGYWPTDDYDLTTPYGQRSFQVWRQGRNDAEKQQEYDDDESVIIVKEVCPTPLLVSCTLAASSGCIEAAFCLMSGKQFATRAFVLRRPGAALYVSELEDAARAAALQQDLLESRQQTIQLLLHGFSAALPGRTQVWPGGVLTSRALEIHIGRLQVLGPARMDGATDSDDEVASPGREEDVESELKELSDVSVDEAIMHVDDAADDKGKHVKEGNA